MNYSLTILLLSFTTVVTSLDCKWSPCEGKWFVDDQGVCNQYKTGEFVEKYSGNGCGWDTLRRYCCKLTPSKPGCKWSSRCWGTAFTHADACRIDFGNGYEPSNDKFKCKAVNFKYECCPK